MSYDEASTLANWRDLTKSRTLPDNLSSVASSYHFPTDVTTPIPAKIRLGRDREVQSSINRAGVQSNNVSKGYDLPYELVFS